MTSPQDDNSPFDTPKEYPYEVEGVSLIAQRRDPYGYFFIKVEKGKVPDELSGAYTSTYEVEKAIQTYGNKLKQKEIEEALQSKNLLDTSQKAQQKP